YQAKVMKTLLSDSSNTVVPKARIRLFLRQGLRARSLRLELLNYRAPCRYLQWVARQDCKGVGPLPAASS
ncbi:MAG: hypothetical protein KDI31_14480, partial [Pseudomonadales bacterium]|nr:hypothetical protein [Pseudomonadales bacterium]